MAPRYKRNYIKSKEMSRRASTVLAPVRPSIKKPNTFYNYGALFLENKGTIARDHLASERTFLAWLRTSISLASIGVGLTQLLKLGEDSSNSPNIICVGKAMGLCFIALAAVTLAIGGFRYFTVQHMLTQNKFPASVGGICVVSLFAAVLSIATFAMVLRL